MRKKVLKGVPKVLKPERLQRPKPLNSISIFSQGHPCFNALKWGCFCIFIQIHFGVLNLIQRLFGATRPHLQETDPMKKYLIVGLGNIGPKYAETRHNIGFKIVDQLAAEEGVAFQDAKLGALAAFTYKGRSILCLKPATFMNLSGKAVKYWLEKENIPLENLLVITDDINLPFGTLRLKTKG